MEHWDQVHIGTFSGPLDLLLTMIKSRKMSLRDVDLVAITSQYVAYLTSQQQLNIEIASEYLTLAAQLIEMKSAFLLPKPEPQTLEAYADLLDKLTQYEVVKTGAAFLATQQLTYFQTFSKKPVAVDLQPPDSRPCFDSEPEINFNWEHLNPEILAQTYQRVLEKNALFDAEQEEMWETEFVNTITTQAFSPQEIAKSVLQLMLSQRLKIWELPELIAPEILNLKNLIGTFLVVLELCRYQFVSLQEENGVLRISFTIAALESDNLIERWELIDHETA